MDQTKAYLEPHDVYLLEQAASCIRDRLLVRILFHLGCRVSEALGLTVDDIDFKSGTIKIIHLKVRSILRCWNCTTRLSKTAQFCPSCGQAVAHNMTQQREEQRFRTLPLDQDTLAMLEDYVDQGGPVTRDGKRFIFGINRHRAWQIITKCAEQAGLSKLTDPETGKTHRVSPHRLRDAFAVHAVKHNDSGDGLRLLQEHLGHSSFNTTARYRKVAGEEHRSWYDDLWQVNNESDTESE